MRFSYAFHPVSSSLLAFFSAFCKKKPHSSCLIPNNFLPLHSQKKTYAQMAELVDALVSNTNGAIRAGSIPALGTRKSSAIMLCRGLLLSIDKSDSQ